MYFRAYFPFLYLQFSTVCRVSLIFLSIDPVDAREDVVPEMLLLERPAGASILDVFAKKSGLCLLAPRLPLLNTLLSKGSMSCVVQGAVTGNERGYVPISNVSENDPFMKWVKMDSEDDYEVSIDFLFVDAK
jgi:hypothetical protein